MLKITGIVLILFGGLNAGKCLGKRHKDRVSELEELKNLLVLLRGELEYKRASISEAVSAVKTRTMPYLAEWLGKIHERLGKHDGSELSDIWREETISLKSHTNFNEKDIQHIAELGNNLSKTDINTQLGGINILIDYLDGERKKGAEKLENQIRTGYALSVCGSVFLVLVLL